MESDQIAGVYSPDDFPLVSAVMVTGKHPARREYAEQAVRCFLNQTWPNKELVIVNQFGRAIHALFEQYCQYSCDDCSIGGLDLPKDADLTLGDLRNEGAAVARGSWIIQWDDDDIYSPTRMEYQARAAIDNPSAVVLLKRQIRLNRQTGFAFVKEWKGKHGGIPGTMIYPNKPSLRFRSVSSHEDTLFLDDYPGPIHVIQNKKSEEVVHYIRTWHGQNTFDRDHVMGKFDNGTTAALGPRTEELFRQVLKASGKVTPVSWEKHDRLVNFSAERRPKYSS